MEYVNLEPGATVQKWSLGAKISSRLRSMQIENTPNGIPMSIITERVYNSSRAIVQLRSTDCTGELGFLSFEHHVTLVVSCEHIVEDNPNWSTQQLSATFSF